HVMIERMSAIKILRQDLGMNVSHHERFLREARAVNRINHPNIVEITDFGEDGGLVFLVMEYVEGPSLETALAGGAFEVRRALAAAHQIASALGRAHELGVIHRDLKPENVLLVPRDGAEFVKLTDFGIAKIVDMPAITFTDQRFGTPGYIPPEQVEGGPATAAGDLYAFGVLFYAMLTGKLPYDAKAPVELLVLPLQQPPVKPSARVPGIPAEIEELVLKMIARRPEDRPRDAFAVAVALEKILEKMEAERLSLSRAPAAAPVDDAPELAYTITEGPPSSALVSPPSWLAAELFAQPVPEAAERWQTTLADLERHIARRPGKDPN